MDDTISNIFSGSNIGAVFYSTDIGVDSTNLARAGQDKGPSGARRSYSIYEPE